MTLAWYWLRGWRDTGPHQTITSAGLQLSSLAPLPGSVVAVAELSHLETRLGPPPDGYLAHWLCPGELLTRQMSSQGWLDKTLYVYTHTQCYNATATYWHHITINCFSSVLFIIANSIKWDTGTGSLPVINQQRKFSFPRTVRRKVVGCLGHRIFSCGWWIPFLYICLIEEWEGWCWRKRIGREQSSLCWRARMSWKRDPRILLRVSWRWMSWKRDPQVSWRWISSFWPGKCRRCDQWALLFSLFSLWRIKI